MFGIGTISCPQCAHSFSPASKTTLIACPACGREMSGRAFKCLGCGQPLRSRARAALAMLPAIARWMAVIGLLWFAAAVWWQRTSVYRDDDGALRRAAQPWPAGK